MIGGGFRNDLNVWNSSKLGRVKFGSWRRGGKGIIVLVFGKIYFRLKYSLFK